MIMTRSNRHYSTIVLRIACLLLFAGHAWEHLVWDIPIRAFFWDQDLLEGCIQVLLGMTWQEYATGDFQEGLIRLIQHGMGWYYVVSMILVLIVTPSRKVAGIALLVASVLLTILALLHYKEHFYHLGQLFEFTIQVVAPILLYREIFQKSSRSKTLLIAKCAIALTFTCHGLYALGFYPQPGNFVDMMISGFGVDEPTAIRLLQVAGIMDIVISVSLFIPRLQRPALWYAVIWGLLTALARTTTGVYDGIFWASLNQSLPLTLYRLPHGLIPLFVLFMLSKSNR